MGKLWKISLLYLHCYMVFFPMAEDSFREHQRLSLPAIPQWAQQPCTVGKGKNGAWKRANEGIAQHQIEDANSKGWDVCCWVEAEKARELKKLLVVELANNFL